MATQTVQATNTAPKKKIKIAPIVCFIVTVILAVLFIYPVYFAVISAFKSNGEILKAPLAFPTELYLQNFKDLFAKTDFFTAIWHTVFLTVVSEVLIILVVPLSAYAIERHNSKATKFVYAYFTAGMMIPFHLYMFPLFKEMKVFHIYGTLWGPIICYIAGSVAFGTLLYTSFLKGVPIDIEEAAKIDGASDREILFKIKLPMVMPSITICTFLTLTNSFKLFDQNVALTAGEPANASEMLALNIYNTFYGRSGAQWKGIGQAKAVVFFLIVVVISLIQLHFTRSKEVQQ